MTDVYDFKNPNIQISNDPVEEKQVDVIDIMDPEKRKKWWMEASKRIIKEAGEFPRRVLWGAYHVLPGEKFVTQQQDEEVALLIRSHPIVNAGWILLCIAMLAAPSVATFFGFLREVDFRFRFMGFLTWYLLTFLVAFESFLKWYYSVLIITNERIVDVDFNNMMNRQITSVNLNHIEEPVMSTRGFVNTMFQYGDVTVQTASEQPTLEAQNVPYPHKIVDIISRLSEDLEKRRERGE